MKNAFFLLLCALPFFCLGNTFKVTSAASAGAGSLAEAVQLAAANGSTTTDYIEFNLPVGQTTILINAPLVLSSNIIIDGTTQAGRTYGISNAKVHLQGAGCTSGFVLQRITKVEIYGLWFSGFNGQGSCSASAISMQGVQQLIVGRPGKGNCFSGSLFSITNPAGDTEESIAVAIQSNRFGMDTLSTPDYLSTTIQLGAVRNLYFGGHDPAEGNRVGNGFLAVGNPLAPASTTADSIVMKNNAFAFDAFNGTLLSKVGISIMGHEGTKSPINIVIANNKIGLDDAVDKISISAVKGNISINNNYIGSLNTAVTPGQTVAGLLLFNCQRTDSIVVAANTINGYNNGIKLVGTLNATLTRNSIYCNKTGILHETNNNEPVIRLEEVTATELRGYTLPNSKIELFSNMSCSAFCENGKSLVAAFDADNTGAFSFQGVVPVQYSLTATSPAGTTSEFYGAKLDVINARVKNTTCGANNGSITGVQVLVGNVFFWEDSVGNKVGTDTVLKGMSAGRYRLVVQDAFSPCPVYSKLFTIQSEARPVVQNIGFTVFNTNCSMPAGKLVLKGEKSVASESVWQNSSFNNVTVGKDSAEHLAEGNYYYKVCLINDSTCYTQYGPVTINNVQGPQFNLTQVTVSGADCNQSNGAIEKISLNYAFPQPTYRWEDSTGRQVGTTLDIRGLPAGKYRLKYKDKSACDTLVTPFYTVASRGGLEIDSTSVIIGAAGCTIANGYIKNLKVKDADVVNWKALSTGKTVGQSINLLNVQPGAYKLYVSNTVGCSDSSHIFTVSGSTFKALSFNSLQEQQPHCNMSNGFIAPGSPSSDTSLYKFQWWDSTNNTVVSNYISLLQVNTGSYFLTAVDSNGCSKKLTSARLVQTGNPSINTALMSVTNDTCNQQLGAIKNIQVSGGKPPYYWAWFADGAANPPASTPDQLSKLSAGNYRAIIKDAYDCTVVLPPVAVSNVVLQPALPAVDNLYILRNTSGRVLIKNFLHGSYTLFDSSTALQPVATTMTDAIQTPFVRYDKTFYLQHNVGSCLSEKITFVVKVFDESKLSLPNAFSPNGDGINDTWKMQVQGIMEVKEWRVFNRYGQQVFSASNTAATWDGSVSGKPVPMGTYYWVVVALDREGRQQRLSGAVLVLK